MSDYLNECLDFFMSVPKIFRPTNLRGSLRNGDRLTFIVRDKSYQLTVEEKSWLVKESVGENPEWPSCIVAFRNTSKKGLVARFALYTKFFKFNTIKKTIVVGSGRRELIDKEGLVATASIISELHNTGREVSVVKMKEILRTQMEQSAMRSGRAIDLSKLPVSGVSKRYLENFLLRHDIKEKTGDMNTVNRNERMSCPRGCYASFILYYAYHGYSPGWCLYTEDAMTCVFAALRSGERVCRLVPDSEFEQYMKLIAHQEVEGALFNREGYPVDVNGIVVCNLKLPSHTRHSEQHLHLSFAIKTLWLFNASGDNGPCTFCFAIPSMSVDEFFFVEIVGLSWTGEIDKIGYVYFSKTRSTVQVAEHWKLNVRNNFIARSNSVNKIHLKKVFLLLQYFCIFF